MQHAVILDQISDDLEYSMKIAKEHHYTHVELHNVFGKSIEECNSKEVELIRSLLDTYDLKVSCLASTVFFLCPLHEGDIVTLFNPAFHAITGDVNTHLHYLENACRIASKLQCPNIRIFPFRAPDNRPAPFGTQEDINLILPLMRKALKIAKAHDITLVLENCPYSYLPKGMMTIQIINAFDDPHLRMLWDPANSFRANVDFVPKEYLVFSLMDELRYIYPKIGHIHVKDYHFEPSLEKPFVHMELFKGDIDYASILHYLRKMNYPHVLSLEAEMPYEETVASMDSLSKAVH